MNETHLCAAACSCRRTPTISFLSFFEFFQTPRDTRRAMHVSRASSRLIAGLSQRSSLVLVGRGPRERREFTRFAGAITRHGSSVGVQASRTPVDTLSDVFTVKQDTDPTLEPIRAAYVTSDCFGPRGGPRLSSTDPPGPARCVLTRIDAYMTPAGTFTCLSASASACIVTFQWWRWGGRRRMRGTR